MQKGEIIKKLIKDSGLSVTEIARRMNVDRRTIYSYMKKDSLKSETLRQLSKACDKEANYLLRQMLEEDNDIDQNSIKEDPVIYKITPNHIKELDQLNKENKKLLRKLVELQEKHIKLHEEHLTLRKAINNK